MKIIFLDIDGVMNSKENTNRVKALKKEGVFAPDAWSNLLFAPWSIQALNTVVRETRAVIVISSRWRDPVILTLQMQGANGYFVGSTLGYSGPQDGSMERAKCRGDEIRSWLSWFESDEVKSLLWGEITHIVIIDDDADMSSLMPALVQTDPEIGLTDEDAQKAIEVLNGCENWRKLKNG